ncbi:MAG: LPP20 family lipoprotein [Gammaproteobacteria bacterium]|nr:LPP20 family lipoprotein [Gammaproteobacteria bacterium]
MKNLKLIVPLVALAVGGCQNPLIKSESSSSIQPNQLKNKVIQTIGYSTTENYKRFPLVQRKLLAIRGAKLNAYRNLAEEIYGIKIKGKTSVKDMIVQNDSYRVYVNTMIKGAHIEAINEKENGFFEAEVSMTLTPRYTFCLYNPSESCLNSANQYQPEVINKKVSNN